MKMLLIALAAAALAVPAAQAAADRVDDTDGRSIVRATPLVDVPASDTRSASDCDAHCRADLERARQATEKYRDVAAATLDGFVETMAAPRQLPVGWASAT
jgi:hypothetical protein